MLDSARDADRDVKVRAHLPASLPDLIAVRPPPVVGHGTRRADSGIPERRRELLDELEVLGRAQTASTAHDHGRLTQVELRRIPGDRLRDPDAGGRRVTDRRRRLDTRGARRFRGRDGPGTERHDGRSRGQRHRREHLARVHGVRTDHRVARELHRRQVGREGDAQLRRDARRQVLPLRRRREHDAAVATILRAFGHEGGQCLGVVVRERGMLGDDGDVGPVRA